jgi:hypothetical protein
MRFRKMRGSGRILALMLLCALTPRMAAGQTAKDVAIRGTVDLDRTDQAITITDPKPSIGALAIGTEDRINILVYIAPQRAVEGQKATINYKAGNEAKSVMITMREPAPTRP